jgi:hypothetical protein
MKKRIKTESIEDLEGRNLLNFVLLHHIRNNYTEFNGTTTKNLSKRVIHDFIETKGVLINGDLIKRGDFKLKEDDLVNMEQPKVAFVCKLGKIIIKDCREHISQDEVSGMEMNPANKKIMTFLLTKYSIDEFESTIRLDPKKKFNLYYLIIKKVGFNVVKNSDYNDEICNCIRSTIKNNAKIIDELHIDKHHLSFLGELVEAFVDFEDRKISEIQELIISLEQGNYDSLLYKFLQEYNRLINSIAFQYIVFPSLNPSLASKGALEALIKPVNESKQFDDTNQRFVHYWKTQVY